MNRFADFYEARDIIVDIIEKELMGPVRRDEVIHESPDRYYIVGKLYPREDIFEDEDSDEADVFDDPLDSYDISVSLSNQYNPSAMGMTFALKPGVFKVKVEGSFAMYEASGKTRQEKEWKRVETDFDEIIDFSAEDRNPETDLGGNVVLYAFLQQELANGEKIITVGLMNKNSTPKVKNEIGGKTVFQPHVRVSGIDGTPVFAPVDRRIHVSRDPEILELDMLYAKAVCYAQGHGCSVYWGRETTEPDFLETTFIPTYPLRQMKPAELEDTDIFRMRYLAEGPKEEILAGLREFAGQYGEWIERLIESAEKLAQGHHEAASRNIGKCRAMKKSLDHSIDLLESDSGGNAFRAFQYANEAMCLQRLQSIKAGGGSLPPEDSIRWYPFQLAFLLHTLPSFIEPEGEERKQVDLLWFPTGGGKTEAYLGIAAFAIFYRRLDDPLADGVTVFMRYTLRLLTLQQFQRASLLILSCEQLRRKYNLGGSVISIGLWVGGGMTPNKLEDAEKSLKKREDKKLTEAYHIRTCPWCGQEIHVTDYTVDRRQKRMIIHCSNPKCDFHGDKYGLPIHLVDETIYAHVPTFIVATVDKFAQIPMKEEPAALFGISNGKRPPELIIQDELHLIAGPLGTMTGLYEAAVTTLCGRDGIPVKIIASTATIRNADKQIRALYGRRHVQFPPQGISIEDSFFAVESTKEEKPERLYLGVMGAGLTATTTLIRMNAAMLFATRYLRSRGFSDEVIDNFWTITNYFNTLRELGSTNTHIRDNVISRYEYLTETKFRGVYDGEHMDIPNDNIIELTSRVDNEKVMQYIQKDLLEPYQSDGNPDALSFVLASNMMSVGIDVGRLGAMIVNNQPKTSAEYIQATSRIGRKNPGLVAICYNQSRSRDRSHYEQFLNYHATLYRHVEASSLTPFSDRARDRGLHAVYISLCRYLCAGMLPNEAASEYQKDAEKFRKIDEIILNYVDAVDPGETDHVRKELEDIKAEWELRKRDENLVYKSYGEHDLLKKDIEQNRFRTMNSMRNVDGQSMVYLLWRQ